MHNKIPIYGPGITYQYSNEGEIDSSMGGGHSPEVDPFEIYRADDIRRLWQESFLNQWGDSTRGNINVLKRLKELMTKQLERLPDNPFVQREAFLVGVTDDGGEYVAGWCKLAAQIRDDVERERKENESKNQEQEEAAKGIECKIVSHKSNSALVSISVDGHNPLRFSCRNIFDFGYVINPDYAVAPGQEPGGLNNKGFWQTFDADKGWYDVRELTPDEKRAVRYLSLFPPVYDGIRM